MNRPTKGTIINTKSISIDHAYGTLEKESAKWEQIAGFDISMDNIYYNLSGKGGDGLSFTIRDEEIEIARALGFYREWGKKEEKEVREIKDNKNFYYIYQNFTYLITRDTEYYTEKGTVSCEYWNTLFQTEDTIEVMELAERISVIINKVKDIICDDLYSVVKRESQEINPDIEIKLEVTTQAYPECWHWDDRQEFHSIARDEKGNIYLIKWVAKKEGLITIAEEETACDWDKPYSIQLIERAR